MVLGLNEWLKVWRATRCRWDLVSARVWSRVMGWLFLGLLEIYCLSFENRSFCDPNVLSTMSTSFLELGYFSKVLVDMISPYSFSI